MTAPRRRSTGVKRFWVLALALAACAAALLASRDSGPGSTALGSDAWARAALKPCDSCDRLRGYLVRHLSALRAAETVYPVGTEDVAAAGEASAGAAPPPSAAQTNVQEAGVDEPDLVKARGSTLFAIAGNRLRSIDVSGSQAAVLDSIELPDGPGSASYAGSRQLLLSGSHALVVSHVYGPGGGSTLLTDLDVADPAAMRELATQSVDRKSVV